MKTIGNLLLTISLIGAMLSAATAYLAPLSLPDDAFQKTGESGETEYARLATAAGRQLETEASLAELRSQYQTGEITAEQFTNRLHSHRPVITADQDEDGTEMTPERLERLRAEAERVAEANEGETAGGAVHLKSFAFDRWPYWWVFAISAVGLFAGSMLVRAGTKAEITAAAATAPTAAGALPAASPEQSLQAITDIVASLRRDLPGMPSDEARNEAIIERLDDAQKTHIIAFIDARPLLVNRLGLGGYAELMDRFAASERQINRAWSAAADGVYHEAKNSIDTAAELLEETRPKLGQPKA